MTQSSLPSPSSGYQAFKEVENVEDLLAWHRLVSVGRLAFNPHDIQYENGPDILSDVLESLSNRPEAFEKARPVLDWLVSQGLSPFHQYNARGDSIYRNLCLWGANESLLNWCWAQPVAPQHVEPDISQRVRSDTLEALLLERPQLGSQWQLKALTAKQFLLTEAWADGRTTLDRMLCLEMSPEAWFKHFEHDHNMELEVVRGYRRLAAALLKESPRHPSAPALYLLSALHGFRSDKYLKNIRADRAWKTHSWHAPLRGVMSDIARAYGFKGSVESQHAQVWQASLDWASQQPPSLMLAGAVLCASQVQARNEMEDLSAEPARSRRGWDILMDAGAVVGILIEGVTDDAMLEAYPTFSWYTGFQLAMEILEGNGVDQCWPMEMFRHPGLWPLALPNTAFFAFFSALNGETILSYALAEGNIWPRTPTFMRMAQSDKILDDPKLFLARDALAAQYAQCRQETLEGMLPQTKGFNPNHARVRM